MNKQQRLRNTADGFMAALVVNGFRGPWRWNSLDWELPFYKAWLDWPPQHRNPSSFPKFKLGGSIESRPTQIRWLGGGFAMTSLAPSYKGSVAPEQ